MELRPANRPPRWLKYVTFFFFQAEDGIRYWSVTGVQTCALPIFDGRIDLKPEDPTINDHLGDAYWRVGRKLEEIGRASCRERVYISVLDVTLKRTDKMRPKAMNNESSMMTAKQTRKREMLT